MRRRRIASVAIGAAAVAAFTLQASAAPHAHWDFNDAAGTMSSNTANTGTVAGTWGSDLAGSATTGDGLYRIQRNGGNRTVQWLPGTAIDTGSVYLTVQLDSQLWEHAASTDSGETLRFDILHDTSTETAGVALDRLRTPGALTLRGRGETDITETVLATYATGDPVVIEDPMTIVLAMDNDADTYEVFYRFNDDAFASAGAGTIAADEGASGLQMEVSWYLGSTPEEYVDVDWISFGTENPVPEPASVTMLGLAGLGLLVGRRRR